MKSGMTDHVWRENGSHQLRWNEMKIQGRTLENKMSERISVYARLVVGGYFVGVEYLGY